jgi:hypothetical protein
MSTSRITLDSFPDEILEQILGKALQNNIEPDDGDPPPVTSVLRVCRRWLTVGLPLVWTDVVLTSGALVKFVEGPGSNHENLRKIRSLTLITTKSEAMLPLHNDTHSHAHSRELFLPKGSDLYGQSLNELRMLLPFFTNLVCFSLYMNLPGAMELELKPSDFSGLIEDLPATVRSFELDTGKRGFMQDHTRQHHFCESIGRRLHSLEHVRLAVTGLCDAILPAECPQQSRLRELVINFSKPRSSTLLCQCESIIFVGGMRYMKPRPIDKLLSSLVELSKQGSLSQLLVLEMFNRDRRWNNDYVILKYDVLTNTTTTCPLLFLDDHPNASDRPLAFELRMPGTIGVDDEGVPQGSPAQTYTDERHFWKSDQYIGEVVEGETWIQTQGGPRFPKDCQLATDRGSVDPFATQKWTLQRLHEAGVTEEIVTIWKEESRAGRFLHRSEVRNGLSNDL